MRFLVTIFALLASVAAPAQTQGPVYVITHIDLMPANTLAGVALLKQFAAATLKETGCTRFEVLQQDGRPNHLTLVAIWKDRKGFDAHDSAAYTKRFREKIQPLIGSPWDERLHAILAIPAHP